MPLTDRQREYREVYLRSDHWRDQRTRALAYAEHRCQVCNASKQLDVHHRTYDRIGAERQADLTVLCRRCHDLFHGKYHVTKPPKPKKPKQRKAPEQRRKPTKHKNLGATNDELHAIQVRNRERREIEQRNREAIARLYP